MWALSRMATRGVTGPAKVSQLDRIPENYGGVGHVHFLRMLLDFLHSFGHSYPYPVLVPKLEIGLVVRLGVARTA